MYLRNAWYVAASADEVGRTPLAHSILDEPVVLWRTEGGKAVALHDLCIHRRAPLSLGRLVGDAIQCGYHGFTYDGAGRCIKVPAQDRIPARTAVKAYPLVERWGWLWIWMGEAPADEALIPDYRWLDTPGWVPVTGKLHLKANYQLAVDNLLDLSHETFLHARTIGNAAVAEAPIATREGAAGTVHVERVMRDVPPPPLFVKTTGRSDNIDRYQFIEWLPPSYVRIEVRGLPVGSNDPNSGIRWWVLNALTPETAASCNYYWAVSRNFAIDDAALSDTLQKATVMTFNEDVEMLEAQQAATDRDAGRTRQVDVHIDGGTVLARRNLAALVRAEATAR
ncbi:MAG: Rieske 2Fe-2S domain-containing protein [Rhodospirillales bacterium]